jgi:hypothetical protein
LGGGAWDVGARAAVVVVELDENGVEVDGSCEHGAVCCIGVGTLGCGGEVVFLSCGGVHEAAELVGEGDHV